MNHAPSESRTFADTRIYTALSHLHFFLSDFNYTRFTATSKRNGSIDDRACMREERENPARFARARDRISRLIIILLSASYGKQREKKKRLTRNVNQGTQDELHTIHDRINGALCSDIKRHNRVFAFVLAPRTRIRIRKKEKGAGGGSVESDMAYSITSPSPLVLLQPALINHRYFAPSR